MKEGARIEYNSGWMLIISKSGKAPLLFLEWIAKCNAGIGIIHKVIDNQDEVLKIRLNTHRDEYHDCAAYINENL